jgi:hypothetical protein
LAITALATSAACADGGPDERASSTSQALDPLGDITSVMTTGAGALMTGTGAEVGTVLALSSVERDQALNNAVDAQDARINALAQQVQTLGSEIDLMYRRFAILNQRLVADVNALALWNISQNIAQVDTATRFLSQNGLAVTYPLPAANQQSL